MATENLLAGLLDPLFGAPSVDKIFSDRSRLQRMLDFEAALARAESEVGIIPTTVIDPIASQCRADLFDFEALAEGCSKAGNLAIPMVEQLTVMVASVDEGAAGFVHWGATSQDAIDTGLMLQIRDALKAVETYIEHLCGRLVILANAHRATATVARTWMQQGVPTVLGLKVAGWLDALTRHLVRFRSLRHEAVVLQFGGAGGTLAALGNKGAEVAAWLAEELQLRLPEIPWHAQRDRVAAIAMTFGLCSGTLGKIGRDLSLLSQTEIGELAEPSADRRGGSSTMPHKRNPVGAAVAIAAAIRVPGLVANMLSSMIQEYERGLGGWQAEWDTLPQIIRLTAGALHQITQTIEGLEIRTEQIKENMDKSRGLIFAEAASVRLSSKLGRAEAHRVMKAASGRAIEEQKHLREVLKQDSQMKSHLNDEEIDKIFDPMSYTGVADLFIDRAIAAYKAVSKKAEQS